MRISAETLKLVGVVIGIFLLAMICLACSLSKNELLDCSLFRCCKKRRREEGGETTEEPQEYTSLNEFVFEAEDEERRGIVSLAMNSVPTETTIQGVFPDLLTNDGGQEATNANGRNNGLNEPLL